LTRYESGERLYRSPLRAATNGRGPIYACLSVFKHFSGEIARKKVDASVNHTKIDILNCLSDGEWWASSEIAGVCGLNLTNASELLRRYRSQSLVNRVRNLDVPRGYLYRITGVGLGRLEYLSSDELKTSHALAEHVGLSGTKKRTFDSWIEQKLGGSHGRHR